MLCFCPNCYSTIMCNIDVRQHGYSLNSACTYSWLHKTLCKQCFIVISRVELNFQTKIAEEL